MPHNHKIHRYFQHRILHHRFAIMLILLAGVGVASLGVMSGRPAAAPVRAADYPVRLGINIAGSWHMMHTDKEFHQFESFFTAVKDLGAQFLDVVLLNEYPLSFPAPPPPMTRAMVLAEMQAIDTAMRAHGMQYTLNLNVAAYETEMELTPGVNELAHPDGTHRWDLPMDWLNKVLPPVAPGAPALLGLVYDEAEHNQLTGTQYAFANPELSFDKPTFAVTDGLPLDTAWQKLADKAQWLRETQYQKRVPLITEHVWPDMFHIFARSGWTMAPKVLKDNYAPVVLAAAMGAALQYKDQGADFWVTPDLGKRPSYPGWSPAALRSALLMGYWVGASALYVENLDYHTDKPHPLASPQGSLIWWDDPDHYRVTNHGAVVRDFYKNYVPANPRPIDWRDYLPRVAIIRLTDGATGKPPAMRDRLLGARDKPTDDIAAEWFKVWRVLTHGMTLDGGNTFAHWTVYPADVSGVPFFVPTDSVAVFDHTVHGPVLDSVECLVACGHVLSAETFAELRRRAAEGATVIIARRLYQKHASGTLPGDWLLVDDFGNPAVAAKLAPFLGPPDVARYRFKNHTVEFRPTVNGDTLDVVVWERRNAADRGWMKAE